MKLGISSLTTVGGTWINSAGKLEAYYGNLYGNVTNAGIFSLGDEAQINNTDVFYIWGSFTQTAAGTFKCGIGPTMNDTLHISGTAKLEGICTISLSPGYTPGGPGAYVFLTYGALDTSVGPWIVTPPGAPPGMYWSPWFGPTQFVLNLLYS